MVSSTAVRASWLFPVEREVYQAHRETDFPPDAVCIRCGGQVTQSAGKRAGLLLSIRDRGTKWSNREQCYIHRCCVPSAGGEVQRIRPRARNKSLVRTHIG